MHQRHESSTRRAIKNILAQGWLMSSAAEYPDTALFIIGTTWCGCVAFGVLCRKMGSPAWVVDKSDERREQSRRTSVRRCARNCRRPYPLPHQKPESFLKQQPFTQLLPSSNTVVPYYHSTAVLAVLKQKPAAHMQSVVYLLIEAGCNGFCNCCHGCLQLLSRLSATAVTAFCNGCNGCLQLAG